MLIEVEKTGALDHFAENLKKFSLNPAIKSVLVLACDENGWRKEEIDPLITNQRIPVFGGVFPKLILGKEVLDKGSLVVGVISEPEIAIIHGLSDADLDYEELIDEALGEGFNPEQTMTESPSQSRIGSFGETSLVLVDGLASRISPFVDGLFNVLGVEENYIGGGAGSLSFEQKPCLFTPEGMIQDAAILVGFSWASGIGVAHGCEKVAGPFTVTESEGSCVKTIDWRPAADVYCEVVGPLAGRKVTAENLFEIDKEYPLGILRLAGDHIVRQPIMMKEGCLICVGDVPASSHIDILQSREDKMTRAAAQAKERAQKNFPAQQEKLAAVVIDCISRWLYMGEGFQKELDIIQFDDTPVFGALSMGEIANNRQEYLEFYNLTTVVGLIGVE